ncbi:ABC-type lipoprotein release transport system permease subunit [Peptoniphilus gorbachii]|uniref:ABC-type lipoprotein release transport system permease subunit n=1 Tax=Peptoniphilus gorbachii TaxID=411567 RepID=A0ABS2MIR4_9FIRM|nr:ABC-type lipoprotein release transport system permease subunit [Peptoniphilus gorbachii]
MACTSNSLIALILGLGIYIGVFVLIILAILALIKYLKK